MLQKILNWLNSFKNNDPVHSCLVYKRHGCAHIDGYLCNMKTCNMLEDYKLRELERQLDITLKDRVDRLSSK